MFSSNAIAETRVLKVEPGSYKSETFLFLHILFKAVDFSVELRLSHSFFSLLVFGSKGVFKLKVGYVAIDRISPVDGFIAIALAASH